MFVLRVRTLVGLPPETGEMPAHQRGKSCSPRSWQQRLEQRNPTLEKSSTKCACRGGAMPEARGGTGELNRGKVKCQ
jgi:hypothetical protein